MVEYKTISSDYLGKEGCFRGILRYDDQEEKFYLNSDEMTSAELPDLNEFEVEDLNSLFEKDIREGVDVLIDGELSQYKDNDTRRFFFKNIGDIYSLE